jgi:hypothetical protein
VNINRAQQLHNTSPSEKRFSAILTSPVAVKYLLSSGGLRQMADAAFLAPIEYCYLAFAVIIDFVIWALLFKALNLDWSRLNCRIETSNFAQRTHF